VYVHVTVRSVSNCHFAYRSDLQLSIVGSPYWMAPECIAGKKYNEKVSMLLYINVFCALTCEIERQTIIC